MLVGASPCTADDRLLDAVCSETDEASSFLQKSKKPTGSDVPPQVEHPPESSQIDKQLMDRFAQQQAEEKTRKAQAKEIKIKRLAKADNVSIDEARILYSADVAAKREQQKLIDIEKLSDMDSISIDEAKLMYAEDKKAEMQQRREIKIEELAENEHITFEKAKQIVQRVQKAGGEAAHANGASTPHSKINTSVKPSHEFRVPAHEAAKDAILNRPLSDKKEEAKPMHESQVAKHEAVQIGGDSSLPSNVKAARKTMPAAKVPEHDAMRGVGQSSSPMSQERRMLPDSGSAVTFNEFFERLSDEGSTPDQIQGRWRSLSPVSKHKAAQKSDESILPVNKKPPPQPIAQAMGESSTAEKASQGGSESVPPSRGAAAHLPMHEAKVAVNKSSLPKEVKERRVLPDSGSAVTFNVFFEHLSDEHLTPDQIQARWEKLRPVMSQARHKDFETPDSFLKEEVNRSEVAPFDCVKYGKPIQCLKAGKRGFGFYELNVETGKYVPIYEVPFSRTQPPYTDLNACGINPVDDKMYCAIKAKQLYIARVGEKTVKFVAKVPTFPKPYTSGTFGPDGTFYIADDNGKFLVVTNIEKRPGFSTKNDKGLLDLSKEELKKPQGFHSAADIVVVNADLEQIGKKTYVIVLNRGSLMVAKYENNKFGKTWIMPYKVGKKKGTWKEKWGAGWSFGGKVFFASNEGKGVYEIDMKALDLTKDSKALSPFVLNKMGKASSSSFNDGANCLNAPDPWKTKIIPWNCKLHPEPAQILRGSSGYEVKKLDLVRGKYELVYSIPFARTKPAFKYLNAVGLSPIDGVPYGCLLFGDFPAAAFLVRIDHEKFEFLAKIKGKFDPIAGTFDSDGNYFFVHNTKDSSDPVMYSVSGLDGMKGFASHKNPKLPVIKNLKGLTLGEFYQFAYIVAVNFDFEVSGTKSDYILGINDRKQTVVVKWNADSPGDSKLWRFSTSDVLSDRKAFRNFGAAWNYKGRVFMAANDGVGLFETKKLDFSKRIITLQKVGNSAPIVNTDGFNCWNIDAPFPIARGRVTSAFLDTK